MFATIDKSIGIDARPKGSPERVRVRFVVAKVDNRLFGSQESGDMLEGQIRLHQSLLCRVISMTSV